MNQWTERREGLVQLAMVSLNTDILILPLSDDDKNRLYNERYFAYMVLTYLGKEIAIHGTPLQKEQILHLMRTVTYEWDEMNQVFSSDEIIRWGRCLHLTSNEFVWSDEISDIVNETFNIRSQFNMTPLMERMTHELIVDVAPAILQYGDESQRTRLSTFIDMYE